MTGTAGAEAIPGPIDIVVMGVSGSGKSTLARTLADRFGAPFIEGDDLHSPEARAKMSSGTPLTDADRLPWLARVAAAINDCDEERGSVSSCSALRRSYRDVLRDRAARPLLFVMLSADRQTLMSRMVARADHFMPAELLDSQLRTLEPLEGDEEGLTVTAPVSLDDAADAVRRAARRWVRS